MLLVTCCKDAATLNNQFSSIYRHVKIFLLSFVFWDAALLTFYCSAIFWHGVMLDYLFVNKATVSLSVGLVTAGDTASVSELSNNPLITALNTCAVESLIAHLGHSYRWIMMVYDVECLFL